MCKHGSEPVQFLVQVDPQGRVVHSETRTEGCIKVKIQNVTEMNNRQCDHVCSVDKQRQNCGWNTLRMLHDHIYTCGVTDSLSGLQLWFESRLDLRSEWSGRISSWTPAWSSLSSMFVFVRRCNEPRRSALQPSSRLQDAVCVIYPGSGFSLWAWSSALKASLPCFDCEQGAAALGSRMLRSADCWQHVNTGHGVPASSAKTETRGRDSNLIPETNERPSHM